MEPIVIFLGWFSPTEIILLLGLVLLYFLPTIIGHKKQDFVAIFLVNLLLGWTIVGWIITLVWAIRKESKKL